MSSSTKSTAATKPMMIEQECNKRGKQCHAEKDNANHLVIRNALEVLDVGFHAGAFVELVRNVQSSLLLFFGAGRPRPYVLGQLRNVLKNLRHPFLWLISECAYRNEYTTLADFAQIVP